MMRQRFFSPIVEGHGEVEALPILIRRIFTENAADAFPIVNPPIRVKSGSFLNDPGYFRKYVTLAAAKAAQAGGEILILLDCEDDCPAELGPSLQARANDVRGDVVTHVVLAYREYETWFLAAAESLRGRSGLPEDLNPPPDAEAIRGAKEWLGQRMATPYDPIIHQAAFTTHFDMTQASAIPSFLRLTTKLLNW